MASLLYYLEMGRTNIVSSLWLNVKIKAMLHQIKKGDENKAAVHAREIYHQLYLKEHKGLITIENLVEINRQSP